MKILWTRWPGRFCLESKIRHSTIYEVTGWLKWQFCLESKIRHSTMRYQAKQMAASFALNPK